MAQHFNAKQKSSHCRAMQVFVRILHSFPGLWV